MFCLGCAQVLLLDACAIVCVLAAGGDWFDDWFGFVVVLRFWLLVVVWCLVLSAVILSLLFPEWFVWSVRLLCLVLFAGWCLIVLLSPLL